MFCGSERERERGLVKKRRFRSLLIGKLGLGRDRRMLPCYESRQAANQSIIGLWTQRLVGRAAGDVNSNIPFLSFFSFFTYLPSFLSSRHSF